MPPCEPSSGIAEAEGWQRRVVLLSWQGRTERSRRHAVLAARLLVPRYQRGSLGDNLRAWSNLAHGQAGRRGAGSETGDAPAGVAEFLRLQKELRDQLEKALLDLDRARLAAHNANRTMLAMRRQRIADASLDALPGLSQWARRFGQPELFPEVVGFVPHTQHVYHPGGNPGANLKSISHRCYLFEVAFVWELTK